MDRLRQEIQQAARRLVRAPMFTLAAALTLALAIGANVAIFTVVQAVLLNPLPYPDSDQLVQLDYSVPRLNTPRTSAMPVGLYYQYLDRARTLETLAIYRRGELTLTGDGEPQRIPVLYTTQSLASVLQISPIQGRWFTPEEASPGRTQIAVISHGLWMRRYGGDPGILEHSVTLNSVPTQIVGIMPASFAFPNPRVEMWIADPISRATGFGIFTHEGVARLRADATIEAARTELTRLIAELPRTYPEAPLALTLANTVRLRSAAISLKEATVGPVARALWILFASVGLLLLVACANVANLFLVRSDARQREVSVRRALGASRSAIARFFLAESFLLSAVGGLAGLVIASSAVGLLKALGPSNLPRLDSIQLDGSVLLVTCALSVVAAVAFGAIPLFHATPLAASLHDSGRGNTASRGRHRARHLLMCGQVALALVLLVSSGLMVRSFQELRAIDPGFDASSALTFRIGLPSREYTDRRATVAAHEAILEQLAALPGVTAVSASTCLPLDGGCFGNTLRVEGRVEPKDTLPPIVSFRAVAGGYVNAMGMHVLRGHEITRSDVERSEPIVIVNQALVDAYFGDEDPIGRRLSFGLKPTWLTIAGVVSNTPTQLLGEPKATPKLYMPMSIAGGPGIPATALVGPDTSTMNYVVRSTTPPLGLVASARRAIDAVDAKLALADVRTLQSVLDKAAEQMAFTMALLVTAACIALVLGVVGIYGVTSYIVSQRTAEIGLRLALGAAPGGVASMIVRQGAAVALGGIVAGLAAAFALTRLMSSILYGVSPHDPAVFAATTFVLMTIALLACWVPARRAARLNPLEALRTD